MQLSATDLAKWQVKLQKQGGGLKKVGTQHHAALTHAAWSPSACS